MKSRLCLLSAILVIVAGGAVAAANGPLAGSQSATENVVLFTFDGLRWEDLFTGADPELMNEETGRVADLEGLRGDFWRPTPAERRAVLMPFFWAEIAVGGQVFGNVELGSTVRVTNGELFSYPGYNEMLAGFADPRIDSNAKRPNPNVTVLEWLNRRPGFEGRVAAFTSWDVFPYIINEPRSGVLVNSGWEEIERQGVDLSDRQRLLNDVMRSTIPASEEVRDDALTFFAALEHLRHERPRVLFISLDGTDGAAHSGRYDRYLHAAHKTDEMIRTLWETLQSLPQYAGKTSLVVATDHGRGGAPDGWRSHGGEIAGADLIWVAVMGPDTEALGERSEAAMLTQSQLAATIAALLNEDYASAVDKAAPPITDVLNR